jgi:hypothetical protein
MLLGVDVGPLLLLLLLLLLVVLKRVGSESLLVNGGRGMLGWLRRLPICRRGYAEPAGLAVLAKRCLMCRRRAWAVLSSSVHAAALPIQGLVRFVVCRSAGVYGKSMVESG